jgi:hypothetical protein
LELEPEPEPELELLGFELPFGEEVDEPVFPGDEDVETLFPGVGLAD